MMEQCIYLSQSARTRILLLKNEEHTDVGSAKEEKVCSVI